MAAKYYPCRGQGSLASVHSCQVEAFLDGVMNRTYDLNKVRSAEAPPYGTAVAGSVPGAWRSVSPWPLRTCQSSPFRPETPSRRPPREPQAAMATPATGIGRRGQP